MSSVKVQGNLTGTGIFTIASPATNTDRTITLPDSNGALFVNPNNALAIDPAAPASSLTISNTGVVGGTGTSLTALNASNLTSGTVAAARLGSGTADSTTYLRGDNTWQVVSTTPTTAQVLSATAGASAYAVGTYAPLFGNWGGGARAIAAGSTIAGSSLNSAVSSFYSEGGQVSGTVITPPAGTWRLMNQAYWGGYPTGGLFLRIS